ncbi:MAG: alcohol dehydrogenase catalytic domain-containing protein [Planctomycetota bacterium]
MRAIVPTPSGPTLIANAPEPELRPGWALIRPLLIGLDPFDAQRKRSDGPALGHRFVGRVERLGEGVPDQLEGARVVGTPDVSCGDCDLCTRGLRDHCRNMRTLGVGLGGCLADLFALPASNLRLVPKHVSDEAACLTLLAATAAHAAHLLRMERMQYVTVIGDTALGLVAGRTLTLQNASVRVLGSGPGRAELCEKWGVRHRLASEVGRRGDQDAVLEASGKPEGLELALGLVRPRGAVALLEPTAEYGAGVSLASVVSGGVRLIGARGFAIDDALELVSTGRIDADGLIMSHPLPLERVPAALDEVESAGSIGFVVRP